MGDSKVSNQRKSWLQIDPKSDFSLNNIPFGIISTDSNPTQRPAIAIGDYALDLDAFALHGGFKGIPQIQEHLDVFKQTSLNAFAALGRGVHSQTRKFLQEILAEDSSLAHVLRDNKDLQTDVLVPLSKVKSHLPMQIGGYTDFYAGRNHAFNAGVVFRGPENALQPNYFHLPVAYHSRASSVVISGTPIKRPWGQRLTDPKAAIKQPEFCPTKVLDIELELGMFICKGNEMGSPIDVDKASNNIFGYVLLNDWSARDVQAWEYVPLGPFNGKNFATSISPWIVLADALEPFASKGIPNDIELQSYLKESKTESAIDIALEVDLVAKSKDDQKEIITTITRTSAKHLVWSFPQMIAHHTITGCPLQTGDLLGSGTISGPDRGSLGSLLEITHGGQTSFKLSNGEERRYLLDDDTVIIRGRAGREGEFVGFGVCQGTILPAQKRQ